VHASGRRRADPGPVHRLGEVRVHSPPDPGEDAALASALALSWSSRSTTVDRVRRWLYAAGSPLGRPRSPALRRQGRPWPRRFSWSSPRRWPGGTALGEVCCA